MSVFDTYIAFIKEGNYTPGRGDGSGWGGLGYGGFQGAMAYQGVVAYYYNQVRPGTHVELNICRWNQVATDVIWRAVRNVIMSIIYNVEIIHERTSCQTMTMIIIMVLLILLLLLLLLRRYCQIIHPIPTVRIVVTPPSDLFGRYTIRHARNRGSARWHWEK